MPFHAAKTKARRLQQQRKTSGGIGVTPVKTPIAANPMPKIAPSPVQPTGPTIAPPGIPSFGIGAPQPVGPTIAPPGIPTFPIGTPPQPVGPTIAPPGIPDFGIGRPPFEQIGGPVITGPPRPPGGFGPPTNLPPNLFLGGRPAAIPGRPYIAPPGPVGGFPGGPRFNPFPPTFPGLNTPVSGQPVSQATTRFSPGELIRRLAGAFTPRSFAGLLPSQNPFLDSIISSLGVPPEDFRASILRSFPTGPNPAQIFQAGF